MESNILTPATVVQLEGGGQVIRVVAGHVPRLDDFEGQMEYLEASAMEKPETVTEFLTRIGRRKPRQKRRLKVH